MFNAETRFSYRAALRLSFDSSYWGRQSFPKDQLRIINAYGALPVVYWNPWDFPYDQHKEQNRFRQLWPTCGLSCARPGFGLYPVHGSG